CVCVCVCACVCECLFCNFFQLVIFMLTLFTDPVYWFSSLFVFTELFSKPSLNVDPKTSMWEGDAVTLRCQSESRVQETRLRYKFYRDEESVSQGASQSEFTIPLARPETSGSYWCEVEAEGKKTEKKTSKRVQVTVREIFTKPTLTVHPSTTLWQGDNVTLRCQSESRLQGTQLRYKFYRDKESVSQGASESEFTIPSARPENSGSYWCEVEAEGKKTEKKTSERVQVTVRGECRGLLHYPSLCLCLSHCFRPIIPKNAPNICISYCDRINLNEYLVELLNINTTD
uniref:Ig-like domain-containing protein n=1 Tax=Erpetoichthys calabaricus TaxID=27687 RepID=A0A8C4XC04_ERPCA